MGTMTTTNLARPYCISELGTIIARFSTFDEALTARARIPRSLFNGVPVPLSLYNEAKCDGDVVNGDWTFDSGLTDDERERL